MPFSLLDSAAVLPLRAIVFQCLLLLVAIALEAQVLRKQLQLGYQPSIRYAASLNLLTVVLGWMAFFSVESLLPDDLRTQLISYVLFGNFYVNGLSGSLGIFIVVAGLVTFFLTFWLKVLGLEGLTWALGNPIVPKDTNSNKNRYRHRRSPQQTTKSPHILAVLQANAWSFTAILVLLMLRYGVTQRL
ncbi:filament integrity protein FraC [Halomicronema sp. CCY15110]|uniref:filament integrity protein FraC n=1 Tax=Halomicronema sp. CCY15110 TaxID=2767773 RepID=UPI00195086BD|nr:filament integrity protein FraC [Halomicronema sp. CCY15110]